MAGPFKITQEQKDQISFLYLLDSNIVEIHKATKISRGYIQDYLTKNHNYIPKKISYVNRIPKEKIPEIKQLLSDGLTICTIANKLNYKAKNMREFIKNNHLVVTEKNMDKKPITEFINHSQTEVIHKTKFAKNLKTVELYGIKYWLEYEEIRGTWFCTNCASCEKVVKKRSIQFSKSIAKLEDTNGKFYCKSCYMKNHTAARFRDSRSEKYKGTYIGVMVYNKIKTINGERNNVPSGFYTKVNLGRKVLYIEKIIDKDLKLETKDIVALCREKFIIKNKLSHVRNFDDIKFIELMVKYFPDEVDEFNKLLTAEKSYDSIFN